jgi:uncharacterized protein (DUF1499 family)
MVDCDLETVDCDPALHGRVVWCRAVPARSLAASLSAAFGALGVLLMGAGAAGASTALLQPLQGFRLFALGLLSGLVSLALSGIGFLRTRAGSGRSGRERAWVGLVLGGGLVALGLQAALPKRDLPLINDITTSPDDPPAFVAAAEDPANRGRDLSYPRGNADLQRAAYPDLAPIPLEAAPPDALEAVRRAAEALGWQVVAADTEEGRLEAREVSATFRFVDDVVVRVRPAEGGRSIVDVRSKSRDGRGDLGANAARIRALTQQLRAAGGKGEAP